MIPKLEVYIKVKDAVLRLKQYKLKSKVTKAVAAYQSTYPRCNIDIAEIANMTKLKVEEVKDTFFLLLTLRYFKPTFIPYCSKCNTKLDLETNNAHTLELKAKNNEYNCKCDKFELKYFEIIILFWR